MINAKNISARIVRLWLLKFFGQKNTRSLIKLLSHQADIDLLMLAYEERGILKYQNQYVSGEQFVMETVLKKFFANGKPVFFDVGANSGNYSKILRYVFPEVDIYAFEPNTKTFQSMHSNLANLNIHCFNIGFSSQSGKKKMFDYANNSSSEHASLYKDVLLDLHKTLKLAEVDSAFLTIDEFCLAEKIDYISFLKIDTEGHEFQVLTGASQLIARKMIGIIQFEFNEMNVISRVFLRDFYELLQGYDIYRLDTDRLISLAEYSPVNEIFRFQNLLAVNKNL